MTCCAATASGCAHVVKPVGLDDFMAAIAGLGMFRAVLHEPPPFEDRAAAPAVTSATSASLAPRHRLPGSCLHPCRPGLQKRPPP